MFYTGLAICVFFDAELKTRGLIEKKYGSVSFLFSYTLFVVSLYGLRVIQPLRKIEKVVRAPEKQGMLPDPSGRECGSCGITLKRARRDCHWCGWKPPVGATE